MITSTRCGSRVRAATCSLRARYAHKNRPSCTAAFYGARARVPFSSQFRDDGKGVKEQVDGVKKAPVEPKFQARLDAGTGEVFPAIHTKNGYVWKGASLFIK